MKNLRIALLALLPLFASGQDAWELIYYKEFPFPTNGNICYVNPSEAWIVGNGFISKTNNGGALWETQYYKPEYYFVSVFFLDNQIGWVVGWSEVLKTTDGGENWTLQTLPNPLGLDVESVFFLNQDTGWIAGSYKTIYYTEDGGDNWEVQHPYELGNHYFLYHIQFYDYNHGCAVGGTLTGQSHGIIMVTENGGQTWSELFPSGSEEFKKVYYSNIDTLWACDRNEKLYKSTDGGLTWEIFIDGLGSLSDMYFINNNHALTISSSHRLNITYDAWQTYNVLELGSFGMMRKFDFADDLNGLSIGNASVAKSTDGGESWARLNDKFTDIDFFDENVGVILPELPNTIPLRTTDGGYTWQPMNVSSGGNLYDLHFISENIGFMISTAPELLKTTDAGFNWQTIALPFDSAIYSDIQFNDENIGFLTTLDAKFIKTEDGGNTWNSYVFENAFLINELFFLDENNGWVGGIEGFCAITHDGGNTWEESSLSSYNITEICFTDIDNGFAGCYSGDIYRTSDGGYNWELISDTLVNIGKIEFTDQNNGWIATGQSVHRTTDGGNSWIKDFDVGFNMITSITDFKCMGLDKAWICTTDGRIYFRDGTTGMNRIINNNDQVVYYPNPVKNVLNVIMSEPYSSDYEIEIYTMGGEMEFAEKIRFTENKTLQLQLDNLSAGVYIMRISSVNGSRGYKFIKE